MSEAIRVCGADDLKPGEARRFDLGPHRVAVVRIGKEARGTTAFQTNRNLVLSEGAGAESVPNLEIETNDVICSHASAVGPIDDEQRYYLESRGIPPEVAERLIVLGFFGEVLDRLPASDAVTGLRAALVRRLAERASGAGPA